MQDTVDHTVQAFLGVTLGCARCHDHMYDPITQKEYYQVRAIFEPHQVRIDRVPGELDVEEGRPAARVYDADLDAQDVPVRPRRRPHPGRRKPLAPGVPEALGGKPFQVAADRVAGAGGHTGQACLCHARIRERRHGRCPGQARTAGTRSKTGSIRALPAVLGTPTLAPCMLGDRALESDRAAQEKLALGSKPA